MEKNKTGLHIFIAEDEELISKLYRLQMESAGHTVTITEDGFKAVEMMKALDKRPDLLLLDVGLPGINGKEVYEEAVKVFGSIPTIFCSGTYSNSIDTVYLSEHPNTHALLKPVSMKTIADVMSKLLGEMDS